MTAKTVLKPPILEIDLWFKQGADLSVLFTVTDANGQPITDSTGYIIEAQIRAAPNGAVLFTWVTSSITYVTTPVPKSTLTLSVSNAESRLFTFSSGVWDCFVTNPQSKRGCVAEGAVTVDPSVTH